MDDWEPALINPIAEKRTVLLLDNAGIVKKQWASPN